MISLWRYRESLFSSTSSSGLPSTLFPSARLSLSHLLTELGFSRCHRIIVPEWSSHCVLSAISTVSTPLPAKEAIDNKLAADGILVYEQWGWRFSEEVYSSLRSSYSDTILIWDLVDSADLLERINEFQNKRENVVFSLSKIVGGYGGGFAWKMGNPLAFESSDDPIFSQMLLDDPFQLHLYKSYGQSIHPCLAQYLYENDWQAAISYEAAERRKNLAMWLNSGLTNNLPRWMKNNTGAPGILPLKHTLSTSSIQSISEKFDVELCVRNFNFSGNPFHLGYAPSLAVPIHSEASRITPQLIETLERLCNIC